MRTITDNNKLIAEFLGYNPKTKREVGAILNKDVYEWYQRDVNIYYINGDYHSEDYLLFHNNWNWLMEAVDKIESFEDENRCAKYNVNIEQSFVEIIDKHTYYEIVETSRDTKIEATYEAVIQFINYYNKQ